MCAYRLGGAGGAGSCRVQAESGQTLGISSSQRGQGMRSGVVGRRPAAAVSFPARPATSSPSKVWRFSLRRGGPGSAGVFPVPLYHWPLETKDWMRQN